METKETLKEAVERARREIERLRSVAQDVSFDRKKLDTGLEEVGKELAVIDFHLDRRE